MLPVFSRDFCSFSLQCWSDDTPPQPGWRHPRGISTPHRLAIRHVCRPTDLSVPASTSLNLTLDRASRTTVAITTGYMIMNEQCECKIAEYWRRWQGRPKQSSWARAVNMSLVSARRHELNRIESEFARPAPTDQDLRLTVIRNPGHLFTWITSHLPTTERFDGRLCWPSWLTHRP